MDRKRLKVTILVVVIAIPLVSVLIWWGSQPALPPLPTQEEMDARLKETAVKADWELLFYNPERLMHLPIYAEGEVSLIMEEIQDWWTTFVLRTEENDGPRFYRVGYWTWNNELDIPDSLSDGDWVTVWGTFRGMDTGLPGILAYIIEIG